MTQAAAATKDDIKRLDSRIDRLEDRMERGFAALSARMDRMSMWQLRYTLALAALIVAANRWL